MNDFYNIKSFMGNEYLEIKETHSSGSVDIWNVDDAYKLLSVLVEFIKLKEGKIDD